MKSKRSSAATFCAITLVAIGLCVLSFFGIGADHLFGVQKIKQGLDLKGGVSIVYEAGKANPTADEMAAAERLIRGRLDSSGYTEADLATSGGNRFQVDIPGVKDAEQAIREIGQTALLTFVGPDGEVIFTGANVKSAGKSLRTENNKSSYVVTLDFDDEGARLFADATSKFLGQVIEIRLDGEVLSNPKVSSVITGGSCYIEGNFTLESADKTAALIRAGSLPFDLNVISSNNVGAKLGANSLETSILAGIVGILLVIVFMAVIYRVAGLAADIALLVYTGLMLIILSLFELTLTLPGIAGIVLSVGMAVDANVIIFERLKEELSQGNRTFRSSLDLAFKRAFSAILDGNVTTLISTVILYWLGTGPVKGFAVTLGIGIVLSMFTSLVVTRFILRALSGMGIVKPALFGVSKKAIEAAADGTKDEKRGLEVVKRGKRHFVISGAVLLIGVVFMFANGLGGKGIFNYDVEFSGGMAIQIDLGESSFENNDVSAIITRVTGQQSPQVQRIIGTNQVAVKIQSVSQDVYADLINALKEKYVRIDDGNIQKSDVSATVSGEMQRMAVTAVLVALAAMFIYISFRFRDVKMGGATIICLLLNALIVVGFYAAIRIGLNYSFIIAILTVLGYSVNNMIVVFDRIRENRDANKALVQSKRVSDAVLIDASVTQSLRRCLYTALTTLFSIICLYIFGVQSVKEFALPIMMGVLMGTYISIFVMGPLWHSFVSRVSKPKA